MELLIQYIITTTDLLQQQLKLIKRRLPLDTNISNLGLNKEVHENLYQCYQHALKISKTLHDIVKSMVQIIVNSGGKKYQKPLLLVAPFYVFFNQIVIFSESDKGVVPEQIKDIAINASEKFYEQDDLGPVQSLKNSMNFIQTQITQLAQFLHDNEYEITTANKNEDKVRSKLF